VIAARTTLPVLGVPIETKSLGGIDSLLSIVQMPAGIPVGTLGIGRAGAVNAALLAAAILANSRPEIAKALVRYREEQARKILENPDPRRS
jgi:5-(carboxyamino)imidazole ribonucleotide mutase